ncbi:MAG: DUF3305 domain-containing protein [Boseongicola sp.]|nr:DUF3305 domain-containing protein [Boseongicola sp.]NNL17303.1 DUF3305 domain-containing protein [Boseongicola sp.]
MPRRSASNFWISFLKKALCEKGLFVQSKCRENERFGESLTTKDQKSISLPLGIVVRSAPGVTQWAKQVWKAVGVLPGAAEADWKEIRREGDVVEFHAATVPLVLYRTDTEAYLSGLSTKVPAIYVVMRETEDDRPMEIVLATASPYEAQDYADTGEELVEKVPMPEGLVAYIRDYIELHHENEVFVKRRRNKSRVDLKQDGIGDARIRQVADVYRAPRRSETIH